MHVLSVIHRPLPLVEVTAQTVVITAADTAAYFPKGMARHLDQRERPIQTGAARISRGPPSCSRRGS